MYKIIIFISVCIIVVITITIILLAKRNNNDTNCIPQCSIGTCGSDGCGGTCSCPKGGVCWKGKCCKPTCVSGECNVPDGCGGVCGCPENEECKQGRCCKPNCDKGLCGVSDGCGGVCGCPDGLECEPISGRCCKKVLGGKCCDNNYSCNGLLCDQNDKGDIVCKINDAHGTCIKGIDQGLCSEWAGKFFDMSESCNNCTITNPIYSPGSIYPIGGTVTCECCANGPDGGKGDACTGPDAGNQQPTNSLELTANTYSVTNSNGQITPVTTPVDQKSAAYILMAPICQSVADCTRMGVELAKCECPESALKIFKTTDKGFCIPPGKETEMCIF